MGCEGRTLLTSVTLPVEVNIFPFHPGNRAPILSIRGWTSTRRSFHVCKGRPKYFPRKGEIFPRKVGRASVMRSSVQRMGKISVLFMLTLWPEHFPKISKSWFMWCSSSRSGLVKIAALFAYWEHLSLAAVGRIRLMMFLATASSKILWRGSMSRRNNMGDSGSPYRSPLACLNFFPSIPFRSTLDEDVASKVVTQLRHFWPKPMAPIVSIRKVQLRETKTLEMSNLMNRDGCFALCKAFITLWT